MLSHLLRTQGSLAFRHFAEQTLFQKVNQVIEERIRPVLQMDGGDIQLDDIKDGVVAVTLQGHCSGCPSRRSTLRNGILGCLQEEFPDDITDIRETQWNEDLE